MERAEIALLFPLPLVGRGRGGGAGQRPARSYAAHPSSGSSSHLLPQGEKGDRLDWRPIAIVAVENPQSLASARNALL